MNAPKFRTFEAQILYFNGLYKLPVAPFPSLESERAWQSQRAGLALSTKEAIRQRFDDFFKVILQKELNEHTEIRLDSEDDLEILTETADLLGDIIVYCASEMARYGIPLKETLDIIMASNFSKLDADGKPIYDETGKVCKGPNYWKPEPMIRKMLRNARVEKNEWNYEGNGDGE